MKFEYVLLPLTMIVAGCGLSEFSGDDLTPAEVLAEGEKFGAHILPNGVQVPGQTETRWSFGTSEEDVRSALETTLGKGELISEGANCEDPPLRMIEFPGRAAFHFRNGKFVGWLVQHTNSPSVGTPKGITAASMLGKAQQAYELDKAIWPSPMGVEYTTDDGYSFFTWEMKDGEQITAISAGEVCFR